MTGLSQCVIQGAAPKDVPETLVNINKAVRILILSRQYDYITPKLWHLYQHRDHFQNPTFISKFTYGLTLQYLKE